MGGLQTFAHVEQWFGSPDSILPSSAAPAGHSLRQASAIHSNTTEHNRPEFVWSCVRMFVSRVCVNMTA